MACLNEKKQRKEAEKGSCVYNASATGKGKIVKMAVRAAGVFHVDFMDAVSLPSSIRSDVPGRADGF